VIDALKYFLGEAFVSLWRGRRSTALSTLTIAAALFVLGIFLVATANLERLVERWGAAAELSVYLRDDATPGDRAAAENALRSDRFVSAVEYVSKDDALARFRRDFPDLASATLGAPGNPFPASLEARMTDAGRGASVEGLVARVGRMAGVADVRYDRDWLERLAAVAAFVRWAGVLLAAVLVLAAALTVSNVVRLALVARRDEVEIMELVGAPVAFIRGPFIVEGILQGAIGAVTALAAVRVGVAIARSRLGAAAPGLIDPANIVSLSLSTEALVMLGGMLVGCFGGVVASRRLR
jgi:cell division transport system permease protein